MNRAIWQRALLVVVLAAAAACGSGGASTGGVGGAHSSGAAGTALQAGAAALAGSPAEGGGAAGAIAGSSNGSNGGAPTNLGGAGLGSETAGATSTGGTSAGGTSAGGASAGRAGSANAGSAGAVSVGGAGNDAQLIQYYGRWNRLANRAITVNGGSHVTAQFSGTGVSARFDVTLNQVPTPTLTWRIDQGAWQEAELAATVPLATGLGTGKHDLFLMVRGLNEYQNRWAPPIISAITFLGLDVTGGALSPSVRRSGPKLEFLGDSITEGVALWPNRAGKDTACWRADARLAYATQTSLALEADYRQVGFGGEGVLKPGNGGVPVLNDSFNWIYSGVARDAFQPDLVIVNTGTVDRTDLTPAFRPAFAQYVATIRGAYPMAKLVLLRSFGGYHADEVKAEAAARTLAGDKRVFFVDTTGWLGTSDYTDGIHPNAAGSTKAAAALTAELRRIIAMAP